MGVKGTIWDLGSMLLMRDQHWYGYGVKAGKGRRGARGSRVGWRVAGRMGK